MTSVLARTAFITSTAILWSVLPQLALAQDPDEPSARTSQETAVEDDDWWRGALRRLEWLQDRGIHPQVGVVTAGSGLSAGVGYRLPRIAGAPLGIEAEANWSIRGYAEYVLRAGRVEPLRSTTTLRPADARAYSQFAEHEKTTPGLSAYVEARGIDYPRLNFYGLGPATDLDARSDFALDGYTADVVVEWQATDDLGLAWRAGVLDYTIGRGSNGDVIDLQDRHPVPLVPAASAQPRFVTIGAGVVHDRRDATAAPTSGTFAGVSAWRFDAIDDDRHDFSRVTFDGRAYMAPAGPRGVVAARLLLSADVNGDGDTPFYLQHHLGGAETLRGYPSYLGRGEALTLASIEYRWRAFRYVEIAPFVDVGVVTSRLDGRAATDLRTAPGVGVRLRNDDRILFRMDVGYRPGAVRVSFGVGPVF